MAKGRGRLVQAQKVTKAQHHPSSSKKQKISSTTSSSNKPKPKSKKPHVQKSHLAPIIPFSPTSAILLIGDGDLSFACSLLTHHACTRLTATVYEPSRDALLAKYPHATTHLTTIESHPTAKLLFNIDARKMGPFLKSKKTQPSEGAFDRIIFNFPHVGGKSTDVNRQVRANQELLVDFFRRGMGSLAKGGKIVVTLFEGEPYTLWNVRDLGRHVGLVVERSFRFRADAYPGYRHARTLGVVRTRKGEVSETGWKGEERTARSFVFVRKGEEEGQGRKRKRKGQEGTDESESESEEEGGGGWEEEEEEDEEEDEEGEEEGWNGVGSGEENGSDEKTVEGDESGKEKVDNDGSEDGE